MQVNDALFPIGGYTHSYGLETYIQQGKIRNEKEVKVYVQQSLRTSFLYTELLAASLAYEAAKSNNLPQLLELDEILTVSKSAAELRVASHKLGIRFAKLVQALYDKESLPIKRYGSIFTQYCQAKHPIHHAVVYGAFLGSIELDKEWGLSFFTYSTASSIITNCVKSIPLSQTLGQKILFELQPVLEEVVNKCRTLNEDDLGRSTPGLDIASMQHEILYSRLYMS